MPFDRLGSLNRLNRRTFLTRAGWTGLGATALVAGPGRRRALAQAGTKYPDWIPASTKPPKRGGMLTRASAWDPPVHRPAADPVGRALPVRRPRRQPPRPLRVPRRGDRPHRPDASRATSRSRGSRAPTHRVWTFKLRQGVKWHNVPPLNGREFVAADVKYCFEAYAKEGAQSFTFQEIEGIETPDKYTVRVHLKTPNVLFPQNVAEPDHGASSPARCSRRTATSRSA